MPDYQYLYDALGSAGNDIRDYFDKKRSAEAFNSLQGNTNLSDPNVIKGLAGLMGTDSGSKYLQLFQMMHQAQEPDLKVVGDPQAGYKAVNLKDYPHGGSLVPGVGAPITNPFEALLRGTDQQKQVATDYMNMVQGNKVALKNVGLSSIENYRNAQLDLAKQRLALWQQKEAKMPPSQINASNKLYDNVANEEAAVSLMKDSVDNPSGPGDVVLTINHLKTAMMGGKGLRITQAELDQAQNARSLSDNIKAYLQKQGFGNIVKYFNGNPDEPLPPGGLLTQSQRQNMLGISTKAMRDQRQLFRNRVSTFGVSSEPEPLDDVRDLYPTGTFPWGNSGKTGDSGTTLSPEDKQAIDWAKSNRGNADAEKILQLHGIK